jgi:hypothetical protein
MVPTVFDGSEPGPPVGYFTYDVAADHWSWSDGVYVLHGYSPHEVPASTETLLRHKHPDDLARAYAVLETAVADGRPFSCYHRIIDRQGSVRSVLSVGRGFTNENGEVEQLIGFFVDLTRTRREETQADVEEALARIAEHRAVIEQAKGVLMVTTGCGADAAFAILRRYSSSSNLKLHKVARNLVDTIGPGLCAPSGTSARVIGVLERLGEHSDELSTVGAEQS